jgi:Asp-tRNA(Asn)/Glu-tRNA(Gln) amidotransferase A subunit family amidase
MRPSVSSATSLTVAWCDGEGFFPVSEQVTAVTARAAAALAESGVTLERLRPQPLKRAAELYSRLRELDGVEDILRTAGSRIDLLTAPIRTLVNARAPASQDLARLADLWAQRDLLRAQMLRFLEQHPVLLMPVATVPAPPPLGGIPEDAVTAWDLVSPCRAISLFGLPAMAVPFGSSEDGLPVGVQLVGRPFREDEVLTVARALEQASSGASP